MAAINRHDSQFQGGGWRLLASRDLPASRSPGVCIPVLPWSVPAQSCACPEFKQQVDGKALLLKIDEIRVSGRAAYFPSFLNFHPPRFDLVPAGIPFH